jgi:hypothetical protein
MQRSTWEPSASRSARISPARFQSRSMLMATSTAMMKLKRMRNSATMLTRNCLAM